MSETERQVPFYCPYCGEQDLRPSGPEGGAWRCAACARAFELRFAGLTRVGQEAPPTRSGQEAPPTRAGQEEPPTRAGETQPTWIGREAP